MKNYTSIADRSMSERKIYYTTNIKIPAKSFKRRIDSRETNKQPLAG